VAKLGGAAPTKRLITAVEGSMIVDELEATAPFINQRYPDEVPLAVRAAITDAELFSSYNMAEKALEPLMTALAKAPKDLRLNQRWRVCTRAPSDSPRPRSAATTWRVFTMRPTIRKKLLATAN